MSSVLNKMISYFHEISLEKANSPYNPYLEVLLVKGRHQLITKNAIYSFDDKYDNFFQSFNNIKWETTPFKNILLLGLGLGSVILMLEKNFGQRFDYSCVEIDPEIIRLAHKYTLNTLESPISVYQTDAETFVKIDQNQYDLILMDVFQNAKVPKKFNQLNFLENLKSKLASNGLLLYNRMNESKEDKALNTAFAQSFQKIFPDYKTLKVKDNLMFYSNGKYLIKFD